MEDTLDTHKRALVLDPAVKITSLHAIDQPLVDHLAGIIYKLLHDQQFDSRESSAIEQIIRSVVAD